MDVPRLLARIVVRLEPGMSLPTAKQDQLLAGAAIALAIYADTDTWDRALRSSLRLAALGLQLGHDAEEDVFAEYRTLLALHARFGGRP